jgi:threonine dehydratase
VDRSDRRSTRIHAGIEPGPTPLEEPPEIGGGRRLYLKREDVHELGSFKWRGALPTLEAYRANGAETVVTASTGNHGAATAWAAERVGMRAIIYAPTGASPAKLAVIERFGADLRLVGADLDDAKEQARRFTAERGLPFFEDGAERAQYEGYRAVGDEILGQLGAPPAGVVVPVGNGALLGGIAIEICRRASETLRIGVVAREAPVMAESFDAGYALESSRSSTFADGLAVRVAIPLAVSVLGEVATRIVLVSEREIACALGTFARAGIRVEGAAAAGLAGVSHLEDVDDPLVLVVTGRNVDDDVFTRAVERPDSFPD